MLPNCALIDYFKNLPYLALKEVTKHFEVRDRILSSVISPKWEQSISSQRVVGSISHMLATKEKFEIKISIIREPGSYKLDEETYMNIQFINSDTDKEVITEEIDYQSRFSTIITRSIIVYRKNWDVDGNQRVLEITQLLKLKFQLDLKHATIENATWMTQNDLLSLDSESARLGDNQLTDKDFNVFLHSWMAGNHKDIRDYSFKVGDDVKIDQVIRGLITEKWDPKKRDRKFIPYSYDKVAQPPIDMGDGLDITCRTINFGKLATVHITDNTLYFITWDYYDTFERQLENVKWALLHFNRELLRETPGSRNWNHWTEMRRKCLESLRNITGDPEADVLENEFSNMHTDTDRSRF